MMGAATEKARLPKFSFVLGIESCCEVDDLSFKFQDAQAHLKKLTTSSVDVVCCIVLYCIVCSAERYERSHVFSRFRG